MWAAEVVVWASRIRTSSGFLGAMITGCDMLHEACSLAMARDGLGPGDRGDEPD